MSGTLVDDRYRIGRVVGRGSAGVVYEATHIALGKRVAIKFVHQDRIKDELAIKRFLREAQSASKLRHPNIIHADDFSVMPDGNAYFVMEYLEGCTLGQTLKSHKFLRPIRALHIAEQIGKALVAAHEQGVVHRDLKPDNIFLCDALATTSSHQGIAPGEVVKVLDFGIAKVEDGSGEWTVQGRILGTFRYMSPEQSLGEPVDGRTDVFSLGVVLYEMVTGELPFDVRNMAKLVNQQMHEPATAPSKRCPENSITKDLEELILKCLHRQPDKRFESMEVLCEHLRHIKEDLLRANKDKRFISGFRLKQASERAPQKRATQKRSGLLRPNLLRWIRLATGLAALALGSVAFTQEKKTQKPEVPFQLEPSVEQAYRAKAEGSRPIHIESTPAGAELWLDNELIGNTPIRVRVGNYDDGKLYELRQQGFEGRRLMLSRHSSQKIIVNLKPRRGSRAR